MPSMIFTGSHDVDTEELSFADGHIFHMPAASSAS